MLHPNTQHPDTLHATENAASIDAHSCRTVSLRGGDHASDEISEFARSPGCVGCLGSPACPPN